MKLRLPLLGSFVFASSCALIADLGDRTLGDGADGGALDGQPSGTGGGDGSSGTNPEGGSPACTDTQIPLTDPEMFLLVDISGSMFTNNKLDVEKEGITQFLEKPETRGSSLGVTFHPFRPSPPEVLCNPVNYQDASVPIGKLDQADAGTAQVIRARVGAAEANGQSPWEAVLIGTRAVVKGRKVTVIFIGDDGPTNDPPDCVDNPQRLEAAVRGLLAQDPPVRTYVVGFPVDAGHVDVFDRMARAGGTERTAAFTAFDASAPWLADSLATIQRELRCEIDLPSGGSFDPAKTTFVIGNTAITNVAASRDCAAKDAYFVLRTRLPDGGTSATPSGRARLCPHACDLAVTTKATVAAKTCP